MLNLMVLAALAPGLGQTPWNLVADSGDVKVYQRSSSDARIYEHRAEAVVPVPPARMWAVLTDSAHQSEFIPYVVESRVVGNHGDKRLVYQRLSAPVIDDRDYTVEVQGFPDAATGVYEQVFTVARGAGPAPQDGVVRVQLATGRWLLEPEGEGSTRISYELLTDPGGWIPAWMVNIAQKHGLPDVIAAMTKRAQDPSFKK